MTTRAGQTSAALGLALLLASAPAAAQEKAAGAASPGAPDVQSLSPGVDRLLAELRGREAELRERERSLERRERSVDEIEARLERRIGQLEALRQQIEERIASWSAQGGEPVDDLARVYGAMPPEKAAGLLEELELDLAVQVMGEMKRKQSAAVLAAMNRERALALSRRLARPLEPATAP